MNKKELRKIKNDEPLPVHVKDTDGNELDYDEIRVRFICEQIFQTKILNSDRPDLYAENQHFGIEVTSASDIPCIIYRNMGDGKLKPKQINYNHLEGMKYKEMRQYGTISKDLCFASINADADIYQRNILNVLNDKLKKLNGTDGEAYMHYPLQYLYITSIVNTMCFSINDFMNLFFAMCREQRKYNKIYSIIFLECIDCLIKFDFLTMRSYFMPDIFKLIPEENLRARKYIIAKHNGEEAPDSPAEAMEKIYNVIRKD